MRARPASLAFVTLTAVTACGSGDSRPPERDPPATGRLEVSWVGSDTGGLSAPAQVAWCPVASRLEVTAVRDDQGFGLVVYPLGELAAGSYPAFDAGIDTTHRPGVATAARWFKDEYLAAFQGDSGVLELARAGDRWEATFTVRLRGLERTDTLLATGRATGLTPGPCAADSVPPGAPIQ